VWLTVLPGASCAMSASARISASICIDGSLPVFACLAGFSLEKGQSLLDRCFHLDVPKASWAELVSLSCCASSANICLSCYPNAHPSLQPGQITDSSLFLMCIQPITKSF
jgi:hypothetical protein